MAKGFKFLATEQHEYGDPIRLNASGQSAISLGGILTNKVGGASVNLGIRFRLDKGFGRIKEIIEKVEEYKYRLGEQGVRDFLEKYIEPDIRANIYTIFKTGGINAYGDGIDWPDNSRLWKKFKEKHLNEENVLNPFFGINSNVKFFSKVKFTSPGQLTGGMYDALMGNTSEYELKVHITGSNLYVGSSLPYLSNFQKDRPVLFIGENQKKAWLEMFAQYASLDERTNKPRYSIMAAKGKLDSFDPVIAKLSDIGKDYRKEKENKEVKTVKEKEIDTNELSVKNKQQVKGFLKYLKTKNKKK